MFSIDEIQGTPLFSALGAAELEHLARTAADIHLAAGEVEHREPHKLAVKHGMLKLDIPFQQLRGNCSLREELPADNGHERTIFRRLREPV